MGRKHERKVTGRENKICTLFVVNFLAHAYLSFGDAEVLAGNMIGDFVKGRKKLDYPNRISQGIDLHRAIDTFTDQHPVTREASHVFRPAFGRYALAFMDVVYDHFLARELAAHPSIDFNEFVTGVYRQLGDYQQLLPETFVGLLKHMRSDNWLFNYQFTWGVAKSFEGLVHRTTHLSSPAPAMGILEAGYASFEAAYRSFFPQLYDFSLAKFADIH